jgi:serine/threonine protein kinase
MALAPGTRVGGYEIVAPLGAGGMGEVYRARDARLNRDVAIKVLPDAFADDAERVARFEREAQLLAAVNHPHIGAIYGIEGRAIVLELVDGATLAERIESGRLPVNDAVPIAIQIAEALGRELDVGRLQIAVDDALLVRGLGMTPCIV